MTLALLRCKRRPTALLPSLVLALIITSAMSFSAWATGTPSSPRAFDAIYRLEIEGWPDANINHTLKRRGDAWISEMRAAIAVANGWERSRFTIDENGVNSSDYASGYSLLGIGEDYHMGQGELDRWPDRQAALFQLSQQADQVACRHPQVAPCTLTYTNYKGEEETFLYRRLDTSTLELTVGSFPAVTISLWRGEHPDRDLRLTFTPEVPGLLLAADYFKDGKRTSRLSLRSLHVNDLASTD
ncbi:hypothetical protein [Halomonas salinarum]|uniref:hypothetical protein n=1 Tax=Halomonas salinarum TaxID=1158993 RepID=UPI00143B7335|nr:hypothetical protein [Halomonas salinarum]